MSARGANNGAFDQEHTYKTFKTPFCRFCRCSLAQMRQYFGLSRKVTEGSQRAAGIEVPSDPQNWPRPTSSIVSRNTKCPA
jgi:hypothetical protein